MFRLQIKIIFFDSGNIIVLYTLIFMFIIMENILNDKTLEYRLVFHRKFINSFALELNR